MGYIEAYELWQDGELSLDDLGDVLFEEGFNPREIREALSVEAGYPLPVGYFGLESE